MTTAINTGNFTLLDVLKRTDPSGAVYNVVEQLSKMNPLIEDMVWTEGNLTTGHRIAARTGLPSIGWRRLNEGVAASKSQVDTFDESCGMMEGHSIVDAELLELNGGGPAYRASEDAAFVAAMSNELETGMFYHSTEDAPEKFQGLSPRLDSTSGNWGSQIVDSQISASGSDQTSVWLVCWGDKTVHGIYPKGTKGGLVPHDMGLQMVEDDSGRRFRAFETVWNWKCGLAVEDARYVARLANIDTSAIAATGKLLIEDLIDLTYAVKDLKTGKPVMYANRLVHRFLHKQAQDTAKNSTLTIENIGGKPVLFFLGIPVRMTDALLNTEAIVT